MPLCGSAALAEHWEDCLALGGMRRLHGATSLWLAGFDVRSGEESLPKSELVLPFLGAASHSQTGR